MHATITLEAAAHALKVLGLSESKWELDRAERELRRCGCPAGQIRNVVDLLLECEFIQRGRGADQLELTALGRDVGRELESGVWHGYATALLRLPAVERQLRQSMRLVKRDDRGLRAGKPSLRALAPQVAVILSWLPSDDGETFRLPEPVLARLHLDDQPSPPAAWVLQNEAVGFRAERYTLHFERSRKSPSSILHVSADSDRYGYDVEDRSARDAVAIEVKGSTGSDVRFFLSANELETATTLGERFLIHFWGEIALRRSMQDEYQALRECGYPIVIANPGQLVADGLIMLTPNAWIAEASASQGSAASNSDNLT